MRIRKRSGATSSGKPELPDSSNGSLHLHATSKSNPSSYDPRSSFLSPASIMIQNHLLLAGSDYGANHRPSKKRLLAEGVAIERKPHTIVPRGVASCEDHNDTVLIMKKGDGNLKATSGVDVQQNQERDCHNMHDCDDNHAKGYKERLGLLATGLGRKREELSEACKKQRHSITSCNGSALPAEVNTDADLAMVDASECPRKVRPLQLILSGDLYSSTAPKLPLSLCPTSSSSTMPRTPPPLPRKFDKVFPSALTKVPPRPSSSGGSTSIRQMMDGKSRDETRNEDVSRRSQNSSSDPLSLLEDGAEFDSVARRLVPSWQGHRRPRSVHALHVHAGRGSPGSVGLAAAGVNAVFPVDNTHNGDPTLPTEQTRKKPKHTMRKAPARTPSPTPPCGIAKANGELRKQDLYAARKLDPVTHKLKNEPFGPLICPPYCDALPNSTKRFDSLLAAESPEAKRAVTLSTRSPHETAVLPAAASDHKLQNDSMQCRRKDGRRWRCKAQVIKAGAPFCHYHTLKMREKHAASVARRLSKKLQEDVKILLSHADFSRNSNKRSSKTRTSSKTSPSRRAVQTDGCAGGCKAAGVGDYEDEEDTEADGKEESNTTEEEEQISIHTRKQQIQESVKLRGRWRKKCKPCIRRLHEINDSARPPAADGPDLFNTCEDTSDPNADLSPVRSWSPLPRCLLNTDPDEWQSDLP